VAAGSAMEAAKFNQRVRQRGVVSSGSRSWEALFHLFGDDEVLGVQEDDAGVLVGSLERAIQVGRQLGSCRRIDCRAAYWPRPIGRCRPEEPGKDRRWRHWVATVMTSFQRPARRGGGGDLARLPARGNACTAAQWAIVTASSHFGPTAHGYCAAKSCQSQGS